MKRDVAQLDSAPSVSGISFPTAGDTTPPSSPAGFLTPKDVCGMLCISHFTLQKMIQGNKIPHYRLGYRTIRFKKSEINAWLEKKRVNVNPFTLVKVRRARG